LGYKINGMRYRLFFIIFLLFISGAGILPAQPYINGYLPKPSTTPTPNQLAQIDRKYGMFMHFGINTFNDKEWSDGTISPSTYNPPEIDADQWVSSAKKAGMKYVIMISKHHDGFCLWDSKYTTYDVGSSGNKTNVVEAVAKACKKYDMGLGIYYSFWDRHQNPKTDDPKLDSAYNAYVINQLKELFTIVAPYTPVVEFWFDGLWTKPAARWPLADAYSTIKKAQPDCQVAFNNNIGYPSGRHHPEYVKVSKQKEGYPIRYFPTDFRLCDPWVPAANDPKIFSYNGQSYYLPFETTMCLSRSWFYHATDTYLKPLNKMTRIYKAATANNNIFIINCPPGKNGKLREKDIQRLMELKEALKLK